MSKNSKVPADFDPVELTDTDIGDPNDCTFYLIRAPKGSDITKLNGVKFSQSRVKQIEVEEDTGNLSTVYELTPFPGLTTLDERPLITANGKTKLGPQLSGLLSVTKSYKAKSQPEPSTSSSLIESSGPVPMPEGLRVRYQPFGAGHPVKSPTKKKEHKSAKKKRTKDKEGKSPNEGVFVHEELVYHKHEEHKEQNQPALPTPLRNGDDLEHPEKVIPSKKRRKSKSEIDNDNEEDTSSPNKHLKKIKLENSASSTKKHLKKIKLENSGSSTNNHLKKIKLENSPKFMYIDRVGSDRLVDETPDKKPSLSNGFLSPKTGNSSIKREPTSSSDLSSSDMGSAKKSKKKKKHKKDKKVEI